MIGAALSLPTDSGVNTSLDSSRTIIQSSKSPASSSLPSGKFSFCVTLSFDTEHSSA